MRQLRIKEWRHRRSRLLLAGTLVAMSALPGCGALSSLGVLGFSPDPGSGRAGTYKAYVVRATGQDQAALESDTADRARARLACSAVIGSVGGGGAAINPLTTLVLTTAAGLVFDAASEQIAARVAAVERRAKSRETITVNVRDFDFTGIPGRSTCLYVERTATSAGQSSQGIAFSFVMALGGGDTQTARFWQPGPMLLGVAAAETPPGEPVTINVAVTGHAFGESRGVAAAHSLGEASFQGKARPSGNVWIPAPNAPNPLTPIRGLERSEWFPLPPGGATQPLPVSISILIEEVGAHSTTYASAWESAAEVRKALRTFVTSYVSTSAGQGRLP